MDLQRAETSDGELGHTSRRRWRSSNIVLIHLKYRADIAAMLAAVAGSFRIARIFGIDIRIHISWLLIFFLITLNLAQQEFFVIFPTSELKALAAGAIAALLFFASVVAHELAHALVARRFNLPVSSITLFILGGVASLTKEPPTARSEFFMAAAGPLTSLVIAGATFALAQLLADTVRAVPGLIAARAVADYLATINFYVALFNLVPGFPLDGGRVLRSAIWAVGRDRGVATRIAARGGQLVAVLLFVAGGYLTYVSGPEGLWFWVIAFFLFNLATASLQQERVTTAVGNVRVGELMTTDFRSAPAGISIGQLLRDIVLPYNVQALPVLDHGRLAGVVRISDLRKVEQDRWSATAVDDVMTPIAALGTLSPDDQLIAALGRFGDGDVPLLPVVRGDGLVGVLYRDSVAEYVRMREMLGFDARR
jgi:Zn-dependent protease/CBS domain-containing protein